MDKAILNIEILNNIPYEPDTSALVKKLRLKEGSAYAQDLQDMLAAARQLARPKAAYRLAFIDAKGEDCVVVEGITLTSRVLRVNLDAAQRVFICLATCGEELDEWSRGIDDMLFQFWADAIKESALHAAIQAMNAHLDQRYQLARTAYMHPGSLQDWPIQEQGPLFALLGEAAPAIGVQLTPSYLMVPTKSVSGIRFPLEESFESCQLCSRPNCPNRRAPYEEGLYERKYRQAD